MYCPFSVLIKEIATLYFQDNKVLRIGSPSGVKLTRSARKSQSLFNTASVLGASKQNRVYHQSDVKSKPPIQAKDIKHRDPFCHNWQQAFSNVDAYLFESST